MKASETALVLVGFQKDYFGSEAILKSVIEDSAATDQALANTLSLLNTLVDSEVAMIQTPILFSADSGKKKARVGLLRAIDELGAFQSGSPGAAAIPEIQAFGNRIHEVQTKDTLSVFSNTGLSQFLEEDGIRNVVLAGAVTSIFVDSSGRSAHEQGYDVTVLSDCTCGRTDFEQEFYCNQILPLYARVATSAELLAELS